MAARSQQEPAAKAYELTGHPGEANTKNGLQSASSEYFNPHGNPAGVQPGKSRIRDISSAHLDSRVPGDNGSIAAVSAPQPAAGSDTPQPATPSISSEASPFDPQPNPFREPTADSAPQPAVKSSQPIEKSPVTEQPVISDPFGPSPFGSPSRPTPAPVKEFETDLEKQPEVSVPSPARTSAPLEQELPPKESPKAPTPAASTFPSEPAVGNSETKSGVMTQPANSGGNASFRGDATVTESAPRGPQQPQLTIEKVAPPNAVLGQPMVYSVVIKNIGWRG